MLLYYLLSYFLSIIGRCPPSGGRIGSNVQGSTYTWDMDMLFVITSRWVVVGISIKMGHRRVIGARGEWECLLAVCWHGASGIVDMRPSSNQASIQQSSTGIACPSRPASSTELRERRGRQLATGTAHRRSLARGLHMTSEVAWSKLLVRAPGTW